MLHGKVPIATRILVVHLGNSGYPVANKAFLSVLSRLWPSASLYLIIVGLCWINVLDPRVCCRWKITWRLDNKIPRVPYSDVVFYSSMEHLNTVVLEPLRESINGCRCREANNPRCIVTKSRRWGREFSYLYENTPTVTQYSSQEREKTMPTWFTPIGGDFLGWEPGIAIVRVGLVIVMKGF